MKTEREDSEGWKLHTDRRQMERRRCFSPVLQQTPSALRFKFRNGPVFSAFGWGDNLRSNIFHCRWLTRSVTRGALTRFWAREVAHRVHGLSSVSQKLPLLNRGGVWIQSRPCDNQPPERAGRAGGRWCNDRSNWRKWMEKREEKISQNRRADE